MKHNENINKITSYNKNNITVNIDQDPINQLVLMLQTGYNLQVKCFNSSFFHNLTYLLQAELQEPVNQYLQLGVFSSVTLQCFSNYISNQTLTHLLLKYL